MRIFYRRLNGCREVARCPQDHTVRFRTLEKVKGYSYWSQFIFFHKELLSFENLRFFSSEHLEASKIFLQIGACPSHLQCYKATSSSKTSLLHLQICEGAVPYISFLFDVTDLRIQCQKETFRSRIREDSDLISCRTNPREIY